jgi:hypothetical protein
MMAAPEAARRARAFHWPLEFPDVMQRGGFDVVLGNPPWEVMQLSDKEYFASRNPQIAILKGDARKRAIEALRKTNPDEYLDFAISKRIFDAANEFARASARFDLTANGKINSYSLFAELFASLSKGFAGVILPTGIATDSSTAPFFSMLIREKRLATLFDFENRERIFADVYFRVKFCLLTFGRKIPEASFSFFLTNTSQLADRERRFTLSPETIERMNPNTLTVSIFRSRADAEVTAKIYKNVPVLLSKGSAGEQNPWRVEFRQGLFNMTSESNLFVSSKQLEASGYVRDGTDWIRNQTNNKLLEDSRYVPLYEGKMAFYFDHRYGDFAAADEKEDTDYREIPRPSFEQLCDPTFEVTPRYWVPETEVAKRLQQKDWNEKWLFACRGLTNATNERTFVTFVLPVSGVGNSVPVWTFGKEHDRRKIAALTANTASLVCDFAARQKIGGTNLNLFYLEQFPLLPPVFYTEHRLTFIIPMVLELTYTSHSLAPFARDLGHNGPPFAWDEDRRALLRADLDAFYARAYGLTRDELRYILDPADVKGPDYPSETFRVLKEREVRQYGEYRTRRLVLAAWDRMEANGEFAAMVM